MYKCEYIKMELNIDISRPTLIQENARCEHCIVCLNDKAVYHLRKCLTNIFIFLYVYSCDNFCRQFLTKKRWPGKSKVFCSMFFFCPYAPELGSQTKTLVYTYYCCTVYIVHKILALTAVTTVSTVPNVTVPWRPLKF